MHIDEIQEALVDNFLMVEADVHLVYEADGFAQPCSFHDRHCLRSPTSVEDSRLPRLLFIDLTPVPTPVLPQRPSELRPLYFCVTNPGFFHWDFPFAGPICKAELIMCDLPDRYMSCVLVSL
jgi:hypothetical protein